MTDFLKKVGVLHPDNNFSLTNTVIYIFVFITAFKMLFSGVVILDHWFTWKVEAVDVSGTLPLLFSLINYGHKRMVNEGSQNANQQ